MLTFSPANKLLPLYAGSTIRSFVFSFLNLFIPVIVFSFFKINGFSDQDALAAAAKIFLLSTIVYSFWAIFFTWFSSKIGIRTSLIIAQILLAVYLFLGANQISSLALASIIFFFISDASWLIPYHIHFAAYGETKFLGQTLSAMDILGIGAGIISPILAGFLLNTNNSSALYLLSAILTIVSITFLLRIKENPRVERLAPPKTILLLVQAFRRDWIAFIGVGFEECVQGFAWPIFLFLLFKNPLNIGAFAAAVTILSVLAAYLSGKLTDQLPKEKIERVSSVIISLSWLGKFVSNRVPLYFLVDTLHRFASSFYYLPLNALAYTHAKRGNIPGYILVRELCYKTGNCLAYLSLLSIISSKLPLQALFLLGGIFSLAPLLIKDKPE